MTQATIALATQDFAVVHDLAQHMRDAGVPFETLDPLEPVPGHISVVITTAAEQPLIEHPTVVVATTPRATVEEVVRRLKGVDEVRHLVLGIDPGDRPGLAVVANGQVLSSRQTENIPDLLAATRRAVARYPDTQVVVRVGHGAASQRDAIVNELLALGLPVELVDETSTTPPGSRRGPLRDEAAARAIALIAGVPVDGPRRVRVSTGEIREIQRRSRIASNGTLTISRALARKVATGRLTLPEAVARHRRQRGLA